MNFVALLDAEVVVAESANGSQIRYKAWLDEPSCVVKDGWGDTPELAVAALQENTAAFIKQLQEINFKSVAKLWK